MPDWIPFADRTWLWAGSLLYTLGFLFALRFLIRARKHSRAALFAIVVTGFIVQTIGLYQRGMAVGSCPLGNTFEILQFISWSLILLYMAVGPVFRMSLLGFFSAGLAAVLGVLSLLVSDWDATRRENVLGPNAWIEMHAALAIFSYGVFAILALTSIMYLIQNYGLKHKRTRGLSSFLPSIIDLEQMNMRLLVTGVTILTVALVVGSFHWSREPGGVILPKLVVTIGVWLSYLLLLFFRIRRLVLARNLAWCCIALFVAALISIWPVTAGRQAGPPAGEAFSGSGAGAGESVGAVPHAFQL